MYGAEQVQRMNASLRGWIDEDRDAIVTFLREIVAIPSMEGRIREVGERVAEEMEKLGFEEVRFDRMGNVLGRLGDGPKSVLYDSHIDTVGLGDETAWKWDPFRGKVEEGVLFGRGACDEKGSTPGMVYGIAYAHRLGLTKDWTLYYFGNMEEWCDGIAPHALVEAEGVRPDYVIIGEPTKMQVYRGHRGRVELKCVSKGRSCHAAMPQLGENAIYKMTRFIQSLERHNEDTADHPFLGRGTVVVSQIECRTPSINAVPDECTIYIDRRTTFGETKEGVIEAIRSLPGAEHVEVQEMLYDTPSYTGYVFPVDKYFPAWCLEEEHPLVQAGLDATELVLGQRKPAGRWSFSTNGIYWAGKAGIPCIGFAPSDEVYAHTVLDQVPIEDAVRATGVYALLPALLAKRLQSDGEGR